MRLKSVAFLLLLLAAFGAGVYYLALPGPELSAPGLEAAAQEHPVAPAAHEAAPDPAGAGQEPGAEEARKVAPAPLEEPGRESHRVFGRVQDALGAPLAGVEVTLMPVFAHGPVRTWEPLARVQSAADGSWELRRPRAELPDRLLCDPLCKGLCPGCGVNLNRETCRCASGREGADESKPLPDWKRTLKHLRLEP